MADEADEWLANYDELTSDVARSKHQMFAHNLERWFALLDGSPTVATLISGLERNVDFKDWYARGKETVSSMVGSGTLNWPKESDKRLGVQLSLFRGFANESEDPTDFASLFMWSDNNFDIMVGDINEQIFYPMSRELRRLIRRTLQEPNVWPVAIPASDRSVALDHNNPEYIKASQALAKLEDDVRGFNGFPSAEDKAQHLAEVGAMRALLTASKARADALITLVYRGLKHIIIKFADAIIAASAVIAFAAVGKLTGLW